MSPNNLEEIARQLKNHDERLEKLEVLEGYSGWVLIEDTILLLSAANIDFQNIPASYKNLAIYGSLRGTSIATSIGLGIRFNNDSGNNYDSIEGGINQVGLATAEVVSGSYLRSGMCSSFGSPANTYSNVRYEFMDYLSTTNFQSMLGHTQEVRDDSTGNIYVRVCGGTWKSTVAINRITVFPFAGSFEAESRLCLYGIR